jgi:hypothetical protein
LWITDFEVAVILVFFFGLAVRFAFEDFFCWWVEEGFVNPQRRNAWEVQGAVDLGL